MDFKPNPECDTTTKNRHNNGGWSIPQSFCHALNFLHNPSNLKGDSKKSLLTFVFEILGLLQF